MNKIEIYSVNSIKNHIKTIIFENYKYIIPMNPEEDNLLEYIKKKFKIEYNSDGSYTVKDKEDIYLIKKENGSQVYQITEEKKFNKTSNFDKTFDFDKNSRWSK